MKKIKIIDLLNMISKGEEVPEIIKYNDFIYKYNKDICDYTGNGLYLFDNTDKLNEEVEIWEEEPKDINVCGSWLTKSEYDEYLKGEEEKKIPDEINIYNYTEHDIMCKVNEIIDYLKSKGE